MKIQLQLILLISLLIAPTLSQQTCEAPFISQDGEDGESSCVCREGFIEQDGECACADENAVPNIQLTECVCRQGFEANDSGVCQATNGVLPTCNNGFELQDGECICSDANAEPNSDNTVCTCKEGFQLDGENNICEQITMPPPQNECGVNQQLMDGECQCIDVNAEISMGGGECVCKMGFDFDGEGTCRESTQMVQCNDGQQLMDGECQCIDPNAELDMDSLCVCKSGFESDGEGTCVESSQPLQCGTGQQNMDGECQCIDPNAELDMDSQCVCKSGFESDGEGTCVETIDMIQCNEGQQLMDGECLCIDPNAELDMDSQCVCKSGFELDGEQGNCMAIIVIECNPGFELQGQECVCTDPNAMPNMDKTMCICQEGFEMDKDGETNMCVPIQLCPDDSFEVQDGECACKAEFTVIENETCVCLPGLKFLNDEKKLCVCENPNEIVGENGECIPLVCEPPRQIVNDGEGMPRCECLPDFEENEAGDCQCKIFNQEPNEAMDACQCLDPLMLIDDVCKCPVENEIFENGTCSCGGTFTQTDDGECQCQLMGESEIVFENGNPLCRCKPSFAEQEGVCSCLFETNGELCTCPDDLQMINNDGTQCVCKGDTVAQGNTCGCEQPNFRPDTNGACVCDGQFILNNNTECVCSLLNAIVNNFTRNCECPSNLALNDNKDACIETQAIVLALSSMILVVLSILLM